MAAAAIAAQRRLKESGGPVVATEEELKAKILAEEAKVNVYLEPDKWRNPIAKAYIKGLALNCQKLTVGELEPYFSGFIITCAAAGPQTRARAPGARPSEARARALPGVALPASRLASRARALLSLIHI